MGSEDLKHLLSKLLDEQEIKIEHEAFKENLRYDANERYMEKRIERIIEAIDKNEIQ